MRSVKAGQLEQGEPASPTISNFNSEAELSHSAEYLTTTEDDNWPDEEDDYSESDFASVGHELDAHAPTSHYSHLRTRAPRPDPYYHPVHRAPAPPSSVDPSEDYGQYGHYPAPHHPGRGRNYGRGQAPNYPPHQGGGYGFPGNSMIQHGAYGANPFSPMSNGPASSGYFGPEARGPPFGHDMMPYQSPYYSAHGGGLHGYMHNLHISPPNGSPVDQHGQSLVPAPSHSPGPDPEKLRLEAEIASYKAQQEKHKQAERQREIEAQIRKDAEDAFQKRMEEMRRIQEENKKELELAKAEAERTARERIEAERKAEDERQKQYAEAMRQAEEKARIKFEAEMKAEEARKKREEEARKRAEEEAKARLDAAIRAQAEATAAAEKKAKEEEEKLKLIKEEAKRKADAEAAAKVEEDNLKAKKKAEAAETAKQEQAAMKKKIEEETRAKMEEAAKTKDKAPIKFKDALGRKFSFPFRLCSTWQGMEELIKQAFHGVEGLGPQVQEGWYDLLGPDGEIILSSVWEKTIQPDWSITMAMWPMDRPPRNAAAGRKNRNAIPIPPPVKNRRDFDLPPGITIVEKDKKKKPAPSGFSGFFAGKPPSKKKSSKK